MSRKVIRYTANSVSRNSLPNRRYVETDAYLLYNGGCEEFEDLADYMPRQHMIKAVRIA